LSIEGIEHSGLNYFDVPMAENKSRNGLLKLIKQKHSAEPMDSGTST
jgi:hypothetical protein